MKKYFLSWKKIAVAVIAISIVTLLQYGLKDMVLSYAQVWEGTPQFVSWAECGNQIYMVVSCDGKKAITKNGKVILGKLTDQDAPLPTMILYENGGMEVKPGK